MERRLNAVFIRIFAAHDVLTSVPALQGGDPYGLASQAALHSVPFRLFALSPDPASY
jgi:hypothetical protein